MRKPNLPEPAPSPPRRRRSSLAAGTLLLVIGGSLASMSTKAEASEDCVALISQAEKARGIPTGLLMAIALTESGLNGQPNPYAMNIAGRSYHASGTTDMAAVIETNLSRGIRSIDVGCMQINLKHHGANFARPTDLLNSQTNVDYGADYLVKLATESRSWQEAVMSYHNKVIQPRRAWYGCNVWNTFLRIGKKTSGFLECGRAPSGSSFAAAPAPQGPAADYSRLGVMQAGPLTPPSNNVPIAPIVIAGSPLAPAERRSETRVRGTIEIAGAKGLIPDVVNSVDPRASAFRPVGFVPQAPRTIVVPVPEERVIEPRAPLEKIGTFAHVGPSN